ADVSGFRVVAAYPHGSRDIPSSLKMIPGFTEEIKALGVEIVASIEDLLTKVDAVLLETNDGRLHLEQVLPVFKAHKPVFVDKPIAASLSDAVAIFDAAQQYNTPVFSSSSLRYMTNAQQIAGGRIGKVLGADAYGPATIEKTHPDLFWYGIHGIEALFTVMGTGCKSVTRLYTEGTDMVVGRWEDDRIGTFRGIRTGAQDFGGTAFGEKAIAPIGPWEGYRPLVVQIAEFFRTRKAPVSPEATLQIFAFMEAAEISKQQGGASVSLESVMRTARRRKI
ncbi:MAG TPA: Gfo/Idh/MocA family oxidoreductase, partial [Puia sp.]